MFTKLQKSTGDKIDVAEQITCYQMVHQPSVILLDHLVPNKLVHAVLNTGIAEVLQLIVNVTAVLTIEQVRLFPKKVYKLYKTKSCQSGFRIYLLADEHFASKHILLFGQTVHC